MEKKPLDLSKLTQAEAVAVRGIVEGSTVEEIAAAIFRSPHTIRNHLKSAYDRLGVRSQLELAIRYWRDTNVRLVSHPEEEKERPDAKTETK